MYNESNGFVKIGVNDMMHNNNHQLMYPRMGIIDEFRRQGVRRVVFGCMFLRHDRQYNKRAKRLNKILHVKLRDNICGTMAKS